MSDQASTIMVNTLEPQSGTTLTVGRTGQNLQVNADSLKANVAKDAGGNAIFTSDGSGTLSGLNSAFGSAQVLLSTQVASASSSIDFTTSITGAFTSTYKEYIFEWFNIQAASASDTQFKFYGSDSAGSDFEVNQTTTFWNAYQDEAGNYEFGYSASYDQANGWDTTLVPTMINGADNSSAGELYLFSPASTTYVKNWYSRAKTLGGTASRDAFASGYYDSTSALTGVRFIMASGNITAGTIKMYGIK